MAQVFWNPSQLNNALGQAFRLSVVDCSRIVEATKPSRSIPVRVGYIRGNVGIVKAGGIAPIFEKGAKPHPIFPRGSVAPRTSRTGRTTNRRVRGATTKALKFPSGDFAAYVVNHPGMKKEPFLQPAAAQWPNLYRTRARLGIARFAARV